MREIKTRPDDWVNPLPESFYLGEEGAPDNIWTPIFCQNTLNGWGHDFYEAGATALFKAGWREVPSVDWILERLISITGWSSTLNRECLRHQAFELRQLWLLGDKEQDEDSKV